MPLDDDYGRLECVPFPTDVHALKVAVIAAYPELRSIRITNLRVYHRGASEANEDAEAAFIASPRDHLPADFDLLGSVGPPPKAFLLVVAPRFAGACARCGARSRPA